MIVNRRTAGPLLGMRGKSMKKGEIYALLKEEGIPFEALEHPAVLNMEDLLRLLERYGSAAQIISVPEREEERQ